MSATSEQAAGRILELEDVHVYYGAIHALKGVSLHVNPGEIVTLIGSNGAGKSTTLRAINGLNRPRQGKIRFQGEDITQAPPHRIVKNGISQSPEGRRLFPRMSVTENLEMGAFQRSATKAELQEDMDHVFQLFPRLAERRTQKAGTMSGGEQQMCAIGRALMAKPKVLLLDEPSMGLAPIFVERIFENDHRGQQRGHAGAPGRAERSHGARGREARLRDGDGAYRARRRPRASSRRTSRFARRTSAKVRPLPGAGRTAGRGGFRREPGRPLLRAPSRARSRSSGSGRSRGRARRSRRGSPQR